MKPTMSELRSQYYAAFNKANHASYERFFGVEIGIKGSWFIFQSCKVQRAMFQTMIDCLNARG